MRKPILFLNLETLVNKENGAVNQVLLDELGCRYSASNPVRIYLISTIPFQLTDETLRAFVKAANVAQDKLEEQDLRVSAVVTPYDLAQQTPLGEGYRNKIVLIDECGNDERRAKALAEYASFAPSADDGEAIDEGKLVSYVFDCVVDECTPYSIYVGSDSPATDGIDIELQTKTEKSNHLSLTVAAPGDAQDGSFNAEVSNFLLKNIIGIADDNFLNAINQFRNVTLATIANLNKDQFDGVTDIINDAKRLLQEDNIDRARLKQFTEVLLECTAHSTDIGLLMRSMQNLGNTVSNHKELADLNSSLIDFLSSTVDLAYGVQPLLRLKLEKIQTSLMKIKDAGGDQAELLSIYALLLVYLRDPYKAQNQQALIAKCSEYGQHGKEMWRPVAFQLALLHLHESQDEDKAQDIINQKIKLCKQSLRCRQFGNSLLREVVDKLLATANQITSDAEQLELLQMLEASMDLLEDPTAEKVTKDFKAITEKAQGKPSAAWRTIGGILAALSLLLAVVAIVAFAAPVSIAAGIAVLITVKTMLASHFAIALGASLVGSSASLCCFFGGRSKGAYQAMSEFDKTVHKPQVQASLAVA